MDDVISRLTATRQYSLDMVMPLAVDDFSLQAEVFTSPPKWHLAHTSWFFETFLLKPFLSGYVTPEPQYEVLFNSYYNGIGKQFPRERRGLLSRPTVDQVMAYRAYVDHHMTLLLTQLTTHSDAQEILTRTRLGMEHEQQHQELFFTDLKYCLALNPLCPVYRCPGDDQSLSALQDTNLLQPGSRSGSAGHWVLFDGGLVSIGASEEDPSHFRFDNECPEHSVFIPPYELSRALVTCGDYLMFIQDGGYHKPEFWLADGWSERQREGWSAPLYWQLSDHLNDLSQHRIFTLHGLQPLNLAAPVCHLSGYEADAYAAWAGARLPTEAEWEHAAKQQPDRQNTEAVTSTLHPQQPVIKSDAGLLQLYSDCWQWTGSAYRPYPGFQAPDGAVGEYNGKFMCNQWVLRGASCVTRPGHGRATYRNFFYPQDRWQFTGVRLARSVY